MKSFNLSVIRCVFILIGILISSCALRESTSKKAGSDISDRNEILDKKKICSLILSLPKFQYHEESRDNFSQRLTNAAQLPQNQSSSENYFYCPGDGTFPIREFFWDERSSILTVKLHATDVDLGQIDMWKKTEGKWVKHQR